jgi:hypothetical protein
MSGAAIVTAENLLRTWVGFVGGNKSFFAVLSDYYK